VQISVDLESVAGLAVAALAGLAVGIEREWSGHASGPAARFAGVRTFFLVGLGGGIAGWLMRLGFLLAGATLLAGGASLAVAAYVMAARRGGEAIEGTTEAAALTVLALGAVAGLGHLGITSGAAAIIVLALGEKSTIQAFIGKIGEPEMKAALRFAVLALVLLPLLPPGPYGPLGGIRPRALWAVVLLFSGLNFGGYLARRAIGEARGYGVAGLLGGLVSSTGVTFAFARKSRQQPELAVPLAQGVLGACTVLLPRIAVVCLALNPAVVVEVAPYLALPLAVGVVFVVVSARRAPAPEAEPVISPQSPLQLASAIRMAMAFQVVLMVIVFVQQQWGHPGVLASAAFLGLTDMDALTFSMNQLARKADLVALAARAIAVGVLANTLMKLALALVLGGPKFRRTTGVGLAIMAAASMLGLILV